MAQHQYQHCSDDRAAGAQSDQQGNADHAEPGLDRSARRNSRGQRRLLVDRDDDALRPHGTVNGAGRPRPRRGDGRHRRLRSRQLDQDRQRDQGEAGRRQRAGSRSRQDPERNHRSCRARCRTPSNSASFSGENWLKVDSTGPTTKSLVASFSRDNTGAITIGTITRRHRSHGLDADRLLRRRRRHPRYQSAR